MRDFIAIGDVVTDAFIRLAKESGAKSSGSLASNDYKLCLPFAEKVPYESVENVYAVGNAPNASVAAARLGLNSALVSNIGSDKEGEEILWKLEEEKVSTELITKHEGMKSNYHYVLWFEDDRTILVKHEHFSYALPPFEAPKWIYLSSLGSDTEKYHEEIADYLLTNVDTNLAFQPGTFQMILGKEKLEKIYKRTKIFFSNVEEAERILGVSTLGIKELLKRMKDIGPEIVVITNGQKGAYAFDGEKYLSVPPYPDPKPPLERTGAGDAFASTVVAALALGKDLNTALLWGSVNSMSVVQKVGAQRGLLTQSGIEEFIQKAPKEFQITEM